MRLLDCVLQAMIESRTYDVAEALAQTDEFRRRKVDFSEWGDYVYSVLEPEFKQMPKSRFGLARSVWVHSVSGVSFICNPHDYTLRERFFKISFSSDKPWPNFLFVEGLAFRDMWTDLVLFDHPVWHGLRDELMASNAVVERYYKQKRALLDGVRKICRHYDTLNEALAAWPALRFFLPKEEQGYGYPFDGQPKPLPEGVDVAELTAMVVRLKLTEE